MDPEDDIVLNLLAGDMQAHLDEDDRRMREFIGPFKIWYRTPNPGLPPGQSEYVVLANHDAVWFYAHMEEGKFTQAFIINHEAMLRLAEMIVNANTPLPIWDDGQES